MQTKYLKRFEKVVTNKHLPLRGDRIFVEVMPKEEIKSAGGIILNSLASDHKTTTEQHRPLIAVVLATGTGFIDDESGEPIDMDVKPGSVIMISPYSLTYMSTFPGIPEATAEVLAMCKESDVSLSWPSIEAYEEYRKALANN